MNGEEEDGDQVSLIRASLNNHHYSCFKKFLLNIPVMGRTVSDFHSLQTQTGGGTQGIGDVKCRRSALL